MKPLIVSLLVAAGLWAGEGFGQVEVELTKNPRTAVK